MPELPEVETIVRQLGSKIANKDISQAEVFDSQMVDQEISKLVPFKIISIWRRGKAIILGLDNNKFLYVHLRMSGHFYYAKEGETANLEEHKHTMVAKFTFADGSQLSHNSIRRFGHIHLLDADQLQKELQKYGPEPLNNEFSAEKFQELLHSRRNANIKTLLMDQSFIAGIGNIYAQEALYLAKINPQRKAGSLSPEESKLLYNKLLYILKLAIKHNGSTVDNYTNIEGSGGFQKYLTVYGRSKCPQGHEIVKLNLGGRGTSYCPQCQH